MYWLYIRGMDKSKRQWTSCWGWQSLLPEGNIITGDWQVTAQVSKNNFSGVKWIADWRKNCCHWLYGDSLSVTYGSAGGWDSFARSGWLQIRCKYSVWAWWKPAPDIYKMYLGEYANELPGSGLLFPLSTGYQTWKSQRREPSPGVNEEERSLTLFCR